jgi:adenine-specific DNA-methyltransferase
MPTLDFKGKHYVYAHHLSVPFRTLSVDAEKSLSDAPRLDDNLIIHGDNLHGLKALLPQYAGKIKCIYIDPPYNTGKEGWCYNDKVNSPLIREWLKKEANPVDKEDMERHDKWLCMMWPRLQLLRELLADDGVIFISIDDNEVHHLRCLMDEIFGEGNLINAFVWNCSTAGGIRPKFASKTHEHLLCYAKNIENMDAISSPLSSEALKSYTKNDENGFYREKDFIFKNKSQNENQKYTIVCPDGQRVKPKEGYIYRFVSETFFDAQQKGLVVFKETSNGPLIQENGTQASWNIYIKKYLGDGMGAPSTLISKDTGGLYNASSMLIQEIFQDKIFENSKPIEYVQFLIKLFSFQNDAIILDSFAGSGTTAHAVLALNQEDGGNRKFILIECEDYADTITAERVRRVIRGVPTAKDQALKNGLGGHFTYCTLGGEMDIENILSGEHLPDYNALSQYVFYTATGHSLPHTITPRNDFFVGETDSYAVYVIYRDDLGYLRSNQSALNDEKVDIIQAHPSPKQKLVFATAKFMSGEDLRARNITFCQIPYAIHNFVGA